MTRKEARKKAKKLVSQMTLQEKVGQLLFNAQAIPRLSIPAYNWWNEALHGVARAGSATVFPQAIGLGATFDPALVQKIAEAVATEGRAKFNAARKQNDRDIYKGLTFWAPNVNLFRDPRWGRGHETYGEDPYLTSELGKAYVKGLQGDGEYLKGSACAKHFAVHSGPEALRHEFDAVVSPKDLTETYLPAFETLVKEAHVESVMGAYNRTNGEPCCASPALQEILREKWGFQGHFLSDCWAIKDFHETHKVTENITESAALAMNNGCDLNCGFTYEYMKDAVDAGLVDEEKITESVVKLFTTRYLLGLFEETIYDQIPYTEVEKKEHLELAEKAAEKSIVLLKNNGILPLDKKKIKTIGIIGPNADSRAALIGNYHGTASRYITVSEGIQDYVGEDVRILTSEGCHLYIDRTEHLAFPGDRLPEARTVAENSDVVILCVGLDETLEGEEGDTGNSYASGDKVSLKLPVPQLKLMEEIAKTKTPTILCLMAGSDIDLSFAKEHFDGILMLWYPGARGGKAAARVLFGEVSPAGKLPITFYETLEELPAFTDYNMKGRTYRYMEKKAQYPFGYGLTYGQVEIKEVKYIKEERKLKVIIKNTGTVDTEEVIQIYMKHATDQNAPLHPALAAFQRIMTKAGEMKEIDLEIPEKNFLLVNENGEKYMPKSSYNIYVGFHQPDENTSPDICLREEYVFVYGTLLKGQSNHEAYMRNSEWIGNGSILGYEMYQLDGYPGIVSGEEKIWGEVYKIDEETLEALDELEEEGILYKKKYEQVTLENGEKITAYVYVYLESVVGRQKISSGKYGAQESSFENLSM